VLGEWGIELCLWTDDAEDTVSDDDMTESPEPGLARSEGPDERCRDADDDRPDGRAWEADSQLPPALSPEEVESLVGS
jgi:hypothetical protein